MFQTSPPVHSPPGTVKRSSLQGDEKASAGTLTLQKGSNFNTMPASMAKVHLQNIADYTSHTLTMRREKGAAKGISTELPGAKSIYICDGELFKQLDGELPRGNSEGSSAEGKGPGYVILPTNNTGTLKPNKGKDDPTKYNISIEQLPQTRLIHLANPATGEPGFGLKTLPADQVSVSCSERDSPGHNLQGLPRENQVVNGGDSGNSGIMSKSETVSTLSMSSLEVRPWMNIALANTLSALYFMSMFKCTLCFTSTTLTLLPTLIQNTS